MLVTQLVNLLHFNSSIVYQLISTPLCLGGLGLNALL